MNGIARIHDTQRPLVRISKQVRTHMKMLKICIALILSASLVMRMTTMTRDPYLENVIQKAYQMIEKRVATIAGMSMRMREEKGIMVWKATQ